MVGIVNFAYYGLTSSLEGFEGELEQIRRYGKLADA